MERAQKNVEYFALDVSLDELQRTLSAIPKNKYKYVKCSGLHGTYDDGLEWLKSPLNASRPKSVLSIGSSVGNFDKAGADEFLTSFASTLQAGDCLIVGIDSCTNPGKVYHAYNDEDGTTHEFILNGLRNANGLLKSEEFKLEDWRVIGEYRYDIDGGRHVAFVSPVRDVVVDGVKIFQDEKIQIEQSNKFSLEEAERLFQRAGLKQGPRWSNQQGDYGTSAALLSFIFIVGVRIVVICTKRISWTIECGNGRGCMHVLMRRVSQHTFLNSTSFVSVFSLRLASTNSLVFNI